MRSNLPQNQMSLWREVYKKMFGRVKVQCAEVVSVLATDERKCYNRSCFRELQGLREENKDLKRQIEERQETLENTEAALETTDKLRKFEQDTYREEFKRRKFRK